jgi:tRNA(Ile)-lysidine synthase
MPILEENYNPRVQEALIRLSKSAAIDFDFINSESDKLWDQLATLETNSLSHTTVIFDKEQFRRIHPSMQRQLVRKAYTIVSQDPRRLTEKHVSSVTALCASVAPNKIVDLPFGLIARTTYQTLMFYNKPVTEKRVTQSLITHRMLAIPTTFNNTTSATFNNWIFKASLIPRNTTLTRSTSDGLSQYFNPVPLKGTCTLRYWTHGDRFQPIGMSGEKKLQDFFSDCKVPHEQRNSIPVLTVGEDIVWIVGYRIADWAKVINDTTNVGTLSIVSKQTPVH